MSEEFRYPDILPFVERICECAMTEGISYQSLFWRLARSMEAPKEPRRIDDSDVLYQNKKFSIDDCRTNKLLEFEQAVRYLGLPTSISRVGFDFAPGKSSSTGNAVPIGISYAICCDEAEIRKEQLRQSFIRRMNQMSIKRAMWEDPLVKLEFVVAMPKEVYDYLPNMEQRYYAYRDGEMSGWRL